MEKLKKYVGVFLILWAVMFSLCETYYFGGNLYPNSKEELMCDLTALFLAAAGHLLYWDEK